MRLAGQGGQEFSSNEEKGEKTFLLVDCSSLPSQDSLFAETTGKVICATLVLARQFARSFFVRGLVEGNLLARKNGRF